MKIKTNKKDLLKYLTVLSSLTKGNLQIPTLSMILWEIKKEKVIIKGTDLNCGIIFDLKWESEGEGSFLISTSSFLDYVSTLEDGEIKLVIEDENMKVVQKTSKANLPIVDPKEFPDIKKNDGKIDFKLDLNKLKNTIKRVGVSVAIDGTRPVLAGMLFKKEKGIIKLVGTDGYRLGLESIKSEEDNSCEFLIGLKFLNNVLKSFEDGEIGIRIDQKQKQAWFKQGVVQSFIRMIEGSFPDFNKIIPESFSTKLVFDKEDLQLAVNQTAVFARQNANIVKLEIGEKVKFLTQSGYGGSSEVMVECRNSGENCIVAFNYRYLKELLAVLDDGAIEVEINGSLAPVKLKTEASKNFFHIIMPVKL